MPAIRTDDGPRRLRAVWLGPNGATLPFEWTYVQWILTLATMPLAALVLAGIAWLIGAPGWIVFLAALYGAVGGIWIARRIMRNVTFDEPLRHKRNTFQSEYSRHRPHTETTTETLLVPPPISDLTPEAAALLSPEQDAS